MTQTLYSLRSEIDKDGQTKLRITKFTDGEVESSYHTSREACDCPAGVRPTCRHRQMLPQMLNASIANTHWFYEHETAKIVDFEGTPRSRYAMEPEEPPAAMRAPEGEALRQAEANPFDQRSLGDALRTANIPGVTVVDLGDPAILHNTIAEAVGEPTIPANARSTHPWRRL